MSIYFVARQDDPRLVKIGLTKDMVRRMQVISSSAPIVLFATCDGDTVEERYFQKRFSHLRVEGEWFRADDAMMKFIKENASPCHVEYGKSETKWTIRKPDGRRHHDGLVAATLMKMVVASYPRNVTLARAQEDIYLALSRLGDGWTRRRVRALYDQAALRVDVYELVDLLQVSGIPESEWVPWLRGDHHAAVLESAA